MQHAYSICAIRLFILIVVISGAIDLRWPEYPFPEAPLPQSRSILSSGAVPSDLVQPRRQLPAWPSHIALGAKLAEAAAATASATPASITVGQPTEVTITIPLTDPQLLPESVNLQRVDATGKVVAVLGALNDSGVQGDATPGDQVFTLRQSFTTANATPILLRVSWAVKGSLGRAMSNTLSIAGQ